MKKFGVVSGFLGAGKTSTMIALNRCLRQEMKIDAALIANDLGARDLVDTMFTKRSGCPVSELTGECICYQTENLADRLRRLFLHEKNQMVLSDIPGCGCGALELVYHKLEKLYPGEFELAPFTVVADPERLRTIMPENADIGLPEEMNHLFRGQLAEADVVALNKIDTLSEEALSERLAFLKSFCPQAAIFPISARTGEGIRALAEYLASRPASMRNADIGDDADLAAAEERLCWYNRQYYARVCCDDFDATQYLRDLADEIRRGLIAAGGNVPHLKLFAQTQEGDYAKLSLTGVDYPIELDRAFEKPCVDCSVVINARAACRAAEFSRLVDEAMEETGRKYRLEIIVFFTECFGMMDEGRI